MKLYFDDKEISTVHKVVQYEHDANSDRKWQCRDALFYPTKESALNYVNSFNETEEREELGLDGLPYYREHYLGEVSVSDLNDLSIDNIPLSLVRRYRLED